MALSRLLQPKSNFPIYIKTKTTRTHFANFPLFSDKDLIFAKYVVDYADFKFLFAGFSTKRVGFCSSVCSTRDSDGTPQLKKDAAAEENREMAVEPLVNESAQTKSDIISKASSARKKNGAQWYSLKDDVHILKDKMLGNNRQQNYCAIDASTPADCTASVVIPSSDVPVHGSGELQDSEVTTKLKNDVIFSGEEVNVKHGKSCMAGEVYDDEVNGTTSEVNQMLNFPQAAETEHKNAFNTKRICMSPGISSMSSGENYCEEAAQINNSELVAKEAEFLNFDKVSSPIFSDLEMDLVSNPENSSSLQPPTISLNSTECVKLEKTEMIIGNISVNLGYERGAFSAVFDGSKKSNRLVDLFQKKNQDQTSPEANIDQPDPVEMLSDLLLKFKRKRVSQLIHSCPAIYLLPETATSDSEDDHFKEIPHIGREKNLREDKNLSFEGDQTSSPTNGTQNIFDLKDLDTKSVNDHILDENLKPRSLAFNQFEHANEPCEVDAEKLSDIKNLIDFIKLQEGVPSTSTDGNSDTGRITENNPSNSNSQRFIYNDWLTASDLTTEKFRLENQKTSDMHFQSLGSTELKANFDFLNPAMKIDEEKLRNNVLSESFNSNSQNLVDCERLNSSDFTSVKSSIEDKERVDLNFGSLGRTELKAGIEIPNPTKNIDGENLENPVPNLIGDPNVPSVLIKNPSRTVKIKHLTRDIRLHHIEEALSFCESNVSGYFLGSTNSVGFIEFETEIGKERALVKHSINVLGKQLAVLRIDAPRTTVVRVLFIDSIPLEDIISICSSFGKVRLPLLRSSGILDVHYKLAEWPNMWNILNRLNGVEIEGTRLRAEPAPIFPPDILSALWHQPKERKCLKNTALALLEKLGKNMRGRAELESLEQLLEDRI